MENSINREAVLTYLEKQVDIYEQRLQECQSFYYDGKIDAFREIYNIIAIMPSEGSSEK